MDRNRVIKFSITEGLIRESLHLPDDVRIENIWSNPDREGEYFIKLSGDRFPVLKWGSSVPELVPSIHAAYNMSNIEWKF